MTEEEWLTCEETHPMFMHIWESESARKKRLFLVACCRSIWNRINDSRVREAVEVAEKVADGLEDPSKLNTAKAVAKAASGRFFRNHAAEAATWSASGTTSYYILSEVVGSVAAAAIPQVAGFAFPLLIKRYRNAKEKQLAALFRHIIGNPFRPYPAPPSWPLTVVQLAESLYAGQDCAFALHDALLEAGHAELAEHFRKEKWHPKGCWVVDVILGKA
jgi:hypothetical protein